MLEYGTDREGIASLWSILFEEANYNLSRPERPVEPTLERTAPQQRGEFRGALSSAAHLPSRHSRRQCVYAAHYDVARTRELEKIDTVFTADVLYPAGNFLRIDRRRRTHGVGAIGRFASNQNCCWRGSRSREIPRTHSSPRRGFHVCIGPQREFPKQRLKGTAGRHPRCIMQTTVRAPLPDTE